MTSHCPYSQESLCALSNSTVFCSQSEYFYLFVVGLFSDAVSVSDWAYIVSLLMENIQQDCSYNGSGRNLIEDV